MNVSVAYYGLLAERRGLGLESVTTSAADPSALYEELDALYSLGLSPAAFRVAVNDEFVTWDHALSDGDNVAFLPPMSGG